MKFVRCLSFLLALLMLSACGAQVPPDDMPEDVTTAAPETEPPVVETVLMEGGESVYALVRGDAGEKAVVESVANFKKQLDTYTKSDSIIIKTDYYNPRVEEAFFPDPEILVGETNRPESAEVLASLPVNSYAIARRGNKIVIIGTDSNLTVLALQSFEKNILQNAERCGEGKLIFSDNDTVTVTYDAPLTVKELISTGYAITAKTEKVMHCPAYSTNIRVAQGAASDGTYAYFVIRHVDDLGAVIYKHRLDDGERVAQSEVIQVGHGNDATFDTKHNRLVIAHGGDQGKMLTMVDPDTLKVVEVINIPAGSGAITYSVEKDRYAISQGGSTLHYLTSDFKLIESFKRTGNENYVPQGMGSDEDYIYFPMSGERDNVLAVYDWAGQYVTTVTVPDKFESESFFWVNGQYYIAYYRGASDSGAYLYRVNFRIVYGA